MNMTPSTSVQANPQESFMSTVKSFIGMKSGVAGDNKEQSKMKMKMKRSEDFSAIYLFNSPFTYFKLVCLCVIMKC